MKHLRIIRGLPGSGKSKLARQMKNEGALVFNNDDLLTIDGIYKWDEDAALEAHNANQWQMAEAMRSNTPLLVLDNTNLLPYHCSPHVRLANYYGYTFEVIETNTPWRLDLVELEKRNEHGVPLSVLEEMKVSLLQLPTPAFVAILKCESSMDPEVILRTAQIFIEQNKPGYADECMFDYEEWRRIGGYEPEGGDQVAESINQKLEEWRDLPR